MGQNAESSSLLLARQLVDDHNFFEGDAVLSTILESDPDNIDAMVESITLWFTSGIVPPPIEDYYEKIQQLAPNSPAYLFAKALVDVDSVGSIPLDLLNQALEIAPSFERAWFVLGKVLFEKKAYGEAIKALDKALEIAPHHAMAMYYTGKAKSFTNDFLGAATALTGYMRTPTFTEKLEVYSTLVYCFAELTSKAYKELDAPIPKILDPDEPVPF